MKYNYMVVSDALANLKTSDPYVNTNETLADLLGKSANGFGFNAMNATSLIKKATEVIHPVDLFDAAFPFDEAVAALGRLKRATR